MIKKTYIGLTSETIEKLDDKSKKSGIPRASIIKQFIATGLANE